MGAEKGINVLLKVGNGAGTEVFNTLAGQKDTKLQLQKDTTDSTHKGSNGWKESLSGNRGGTITCSGTAQWPDTTGLEALRASYMGDTPINCEAILNANGDKYTGAFHVTNWEISGPESGTTDYSFTLQSTGVLAHEEGE